MPHEPSHAADTANEAMLIAAKAVEAARLDERERCAKIADQEAAERKATARQYVRSKWLFGEQETARVSAAKIATIIRNGGEL